MTTKRAYELRPGDLLGEQPIGRVQVKSPYAPAPTGVEVEMMSGAILRFPNANEIVRLTAACAYTSFYCAN